jgi:hypothetical protein
MLEAYRQHVAEREHRKRGAARGGGAAAAASALAARFNTEAAPEVRALTLRGR